MFFGYSSWLAIRSLRLCETDFVIFITKRRVCTTLGHTRTIQLLAIVTSIFLSVDFVVVLVAHRSKSSMWFELIRFHFCGFCSFCMYDFFFGSLMWTCMRFFSCLILLLSRLLSSFSRVLFCSTLFGRIKYGIVISFFELIKLQLGWSFFFF